MQLTQPQQEAVKLIAQKLNNAQYAVRGTCSLVLQNINMNVDDIDIVCDEDTALKANELFFEHTVTPVAYKESPKFKSFFGKFDINGVDVEFMGNWQIKDAKGNWSKIYDGSSYNEVMLDGLPVRVTKIEDELEVFLLMGRFNAYHKIKKQLGQTKNSEQINQKGLFN